MSAILSRSQCAKWPYLLRCWDCSEELSSIYHPLGHALFITVKQLRFRMWLDMYEMFSNGEYIHNMHNYMQWIGELMHWSPRDPDSIL